MDSSDSSLIECSTTFGIRREKNFNYRADATVPSSRRRCDKTMVSALLSSKIALVPTGCEGLHTVDAEQRSFLIHPHGASASKTTPARLRSCTPKTAPRSPRIRPGNRGSRVRLEFKTFVPSPLICPRPEPKKKIRCKECRRGAHRHFFGALSP